eukprot:TRINITY_DN5853_c0_g1_i1.p1 TRINITY_DN5853_c0_g1~~TRINITY_DN5853_c0_g1_i1.p1  ORF type:complete len:619 (-),score=185.25 TRINITY_DN5853_c0_g1_i1:200-2056(-)
MERPSYDPRQLLKLRDLPQSSKSLPSLALVAPELVNKTFKFQDNKPVLAKRTHDEEKISPHKFQLRLSFQKKKAKKVNDKPAAAPRSFDRRPRFGKVSRKEKRQNRTKNNLSFLSGEAPLNAKNQNTATLLNDGNESDSFFDDQDDDEDMFTLTSASHMIEPQKQPMVSPVKSLMRRHNHSRKQKQKQTRSYNKKKNKLDLTGGNELLIKTPTKRLLTPTKSVGNAKMTTPLRSRSSRSNLLRTPSALRKQQAIEKTKQEIEEEKQRKWREKVADAAFEALFFRESQENFGSETEGSSVEDMGFSCNVKVILQHMLFPEDTKEPSFFGSDDGMREVADHHWKKLCTIKLVRKLMGEVLHGEPTIQATRRSILRALFRKIRDLRFPMCEVLCEVSYDVLMIDKLVAERGLDPTLDEKPAPSFASYLELLEHIVGRLSLMPPRLGGPVEGNNWTRAMLFISKAVSNVFLASLARENHWKTVIGVCERTVQALPNAAAIIMGRVMGALPIHGDSILKLHFVQLLRRVLTCGPSIPQVVCSVPRLCSTFQNLIVESVACPHAELCGQALQCLGNMYFLGQYILPFPHTVHKLKEKLHQNRNHWNETVAAQSDKIFDTLLDYD